MISGADLITGEVPHEVVFLELRVTCLTVDDGDIQHAQLLGQFIVLCKSHGGKLQHIYYVDLSLSLYTSKSSTLFRSSVGCMGTSGFLAFFMPGIKNDMLAASSINISIRLHP